MAKLSELRGRTNDRQSNNQQTNEQLGVIRNAAAYPRPIDALYQGQPVTLIATGDIVGMSPAVQIVDESGKVDWVSSEDVTITQREFLPVNEQQQTRLRQSQHQFAK